MVFAGAPSGTESRPSAAVGVWTKEHNVHGMSERITETEAGSAVVPAVDLIAERSHVKNEVITAIAEGENITRVKINSGL